MANFSKKPIIALYNYGGGMRGLIPAHFMQQIEETTGLNMSDLIDVFMGPSTGSILNAALNVPSPHEPTKPKFKARHMVRFYEREGGHIFPHDSFRSFRSMIHDFNNRTLGFDKLGNLVKHGHYQQANLGRSLRGLYGKHKISDSLKSLIIPVYNIEGTASYKNVSEGRAHRGNPFLNEGGHAMWLKNLKFDGVINRPPCPEVDIYDAVMGSTAAPTYFECHSFPVKKTPDSPTGSVVAIDGSVFDNPCISYMGALRPHLPPDRPIIMIVLGTGYSNTSIRKDDWDRYGALGVVDPKNDMPLINIFFHAPETALVEAFESEMGENLYVFNKSMVSGPYLRDYPSVEIDDASPENIRRLKNFFEMTLEENRKPFDELCQLLVQNYDWKEDAPLSEPPQNNDGGLKRRIYKKLLGK
jgi:predicted acylesterase/phospholipase RssA